MFGYTLSVLRKPPVLKMAERGGFLSFACQLLLSAALLLWASVSLADDTAEKIYAAYQQDIHQVRIVDRGSGAKAGIGSGFSAGAGDLIVTNYHVVSELVNRPGHYRAELVGEDNDNEPLTLLAVDVVHDLAVLRLETARPHFLALSPVRPAMGEELFSFGNPHDLGLTIVQGTYNGLLEKSLYEKIHFTASINPGMSGGPTLNRNGEVVGVNVSTAGNQISFLVPVSYVATLLAAVPEEPPAAEDLTASVREQLLANQRDYFSALLEQPFTAAEIGDYHLPGELAPYIRCWGDTSPARELLFSRTYQVCDSTDDIYLSRALQTGIIRFRHELYATEELGPLRFYNFLESGFNNPRLALDGSEEDVTNYECQSDFVTHDGLDAKVVYCLRGYKKYTDLYDLFLTATTLVKDDEALRTTLILAGVDAENARRFAQNYLEALQWNP